MLDDDRVPTTSLRASASNVPTRMSSGLPNGPWPTNTQEELLRAALFDADEAKSAWRRWRCELPLEDIDPASLRLLPLAYRNLTSLGVEDPAMVRLKGVYRLTWAQNQLLFREASSLLRRLREAEVPTLLLKGAALTALHYRDAGVRPMGDLDLLVPFERAAKACRVLERSSWIPAIERPERLTRMTHNVPFTRTDAGVVVELHWYSLFLVAPDDDFWQAAVPVELDGVPSAALAPSDQLLHICAHGVAWSPEYRLQWVADGVTLIRSAGATLDWERLVERAAARRVSTYVCAGLRYLRESFQAPVPLETIERLAALPKPRFEQIGYRARTSRPGPLRVLSVGWDRYRRFRLLGNRGPAPPSYLSVLKLLGGYRSWRSLAAAAARIVTGAGRARLPGASGRSGP